MIHFIERIRDYFTRKDCADMAIRNWKSANEELYANFCNAWMLLKRVTYLF